MTAHLLDTLLRLLAIARQRGDLAAMILLQQRIQRFGR